MFQYQEIAPAVADHQNFGAFDIILGMGFRAFFNHSFRLILELNDV